MRGAVSCPGLITMWDKLEAIEQRNRELEAEMARPEIAGDYDRVQGLAREHASLQEIIEIITKYRRLQESLAQARETVAKVRGRLESQALSGRVPVGAPPRTGPDFSGMTTEEKIRYGLDRR